MLVPKQWVASAGDDDLGPKLCVVAEYLRDIRLQIARGEQLGEDQLVIIELLISKHLPKRK